MNDTPALRPDFAVGKSLRAVARQIVADARTALTRPDAQAVHDFRREMKRWRAFLRLIDPFIGKDGRRLRVQARDLARALGGVRDAQAALDGLADLARHDHGLPERSIALMRRQIERLRQAAETNTLNGDMRIRLAAALDEAESAIASWRLKDLTFSDAADRLVRGFHSARRALPKSWNDAEPEELHDLRKRVITHRYQIEIVKPLWPRFARMWIGEAQRLRGRLGNHQDLLLLAKLTGPEQPLVRWRSRLAPAIAHRKATHVRAARRIATRLFVEKPQAFRRRLDVMWDAGA